MGYANKIAQAQKLCTAQGLSSDVCRKVAKVANNSDLVAFEAELDANIEQVEFAQQALEHAKASGDESAVHLRKKIWIKLYDLSLMRLKILIQL